MMRPFPLLLPLWASAALMMAADAKGNTDLHQAALTGTSDHVRQWLERGADAKQANALGITPLRRTIALVPHFTWRYRLRPTSMERDTNHDT